MVNLPEFDYMAALIEQISTHGLRIATLEHEINTRRAEIARDVMLSTKYFVNGKAPSMSYIKETWFVTGLEDDGLSEKILEYETRKVEEAKCKNMLDLAKAQIDIWRTVQANQRSAVL